MRTADKGAARQAVLERLHPYATFSAQAGLQARDEQHQPDSETAPFTASLAPNQSL